VPDDDYDFEESKDRRESCIEDEMEASESESYPKILEVVNPR
jgi:hypothetical protein